MGRDSWGRSTEGNEWTRYTVDELKASTPNALATGPFGSAISSRHFTEHGVPVIRGSNLSQDVGTRLNDAGLVFISERKAKEFSRSLVKPGDLVFTCWGTIDQVGLIDGRSLFQEYVISNKQMKLTPDTRKTDNLFLYYLFSSPSVRNEILNQGIGSSVPGFNLGQLRSMTLPIPPLPEQRTIAHILGTLDDKIECNRRMNATLEAMARTLFKSWFLDFDPVHAKAALRRHAAPITPPLGGSRQAQGDSPPARRWGVARRHYPRRALPIARTLRQPQTDAEALLWYYLRDKQLDGYKFRRQHPIGPYIVDFACLSRKVLIELDGGHHAEQQEQDEARDRFLRNEGYRVLRFWNNEVFENCGGVLEAIRAAVQDPPPQPSAPDGLPAATPPQGGSDWSVERARAYLDGMDPGVAVLFPDRFEDSELGAVPAGWEVKSLGEVIELAYGKALKAAARKGGPIPVYGSNGQVGWHDKKLVTGPGIVVGRKGNPGVITWVESDFFPIDTTFYVVPKEGKHGLHFLFYALERQGLADLTADSAVPGLNRNLAYMNKLLIPDDMTIESFNDYAKTLFARRHRLEEESRTLAALRDTLLPKLISGELRVRDVSNCAQ